jgi:hypothetical protein
MVYGLQWFRAEGLGEHTMNDVAVLLEMTVFFRRQRRQLFFRRQRPYSGSTDAQPEGLIPRNLTLNSKRRRMSLRAGGQN